MPKGLLFTIIASCFIAYPQAAKIIYPWRAATAIVKAGESFTAWFDADNGQSVTAAELQGPYNTVSTTMSAETGDWEYDEISGNRYDIRVSITVPEETPADRYNLVLRTTSGDNVSKSAVKVVREYKADYHIMHLSDQHISSTGDDLKFKRLSAIVNIANIIDPEFVLVTGDNVKGTQSDNVYNMVFDGDEQAGIKGYNDLHAPSFMVAGNHEMEDKGSHAGKSDAWNQKWGLQAHHFKYGNARIMLFNNAWGSDWTYQRNNHEAWLADQGTGGNLNVAAAHQSAGDVMDAWIPRVNLGRWYVGHNHHLAKYNPYKRDGEFIQYHVYSLTDYFQFGLQGVNNETGEVTVLGKENTVRDNDRNPDGLEAFGMRTGMYDALENTSQNNSTNTSTWIPNLTLEYDRDNDGTSPTNTATLVNRYSDPIPGARVRFVMPQGETYAVSQGTIEQAFDGEEFHVVDVRIDLEADNTTAVEIYPGEAAVFPVEKKHRRQPPICSGTLDLSSYKDVNRVTVFDPAGSTLFSHTVRDGQESVSLQGLEERLFIIHLSTDNGIVSWPVIMIRTP